MLLWFFFFKQKTAYEMRISDWSSDVCSSDLGEPEQRIRFRIAAPPENPASDIIADDRAHLERMARSRTGDPDIGEIGVAIDDVMAVVAIFGLADARGDDRLALQPGHPAGDIVLDLALQDRGRHPIAVVGVHRPEIGRAHV